jgi:hypothetical protein
MPCPSFSDSAMFHLIPTTTSRTKYLYENRESIRQRLALVTGFYGASPPSKDIFLSHLKIGIK